MTERHNVRVIFDLDPETGEATGTVHPFCSQSCRDEYIPASPHVAHGRSSTDDFGFVPKCEQCGAFVSEEPDDESTFLR